MDVSRLVKGYVKIRDAKREAEAEAKKKIDVLQEQLDIIEQELLQLCKDTGQDGGKTEFGSFKRSVKTRYDTSDWDRMYEFVKEHGVPELLERRISQTAFAEFINQHPDLLPEGTNVVSRYAVTVTRSRAH